MEQKLRGIRNNTGSFWEGLRRSSFGERVGIKKTKRFYGWGGDSKRVKTSGMPGATQAGVFRLGGFVATCAAGVGGRAKLKTAFGGSVGIGGGGKGDTFSVRFSPKICLTGHWKELAER